jgi:hypothetical protein
MRKLYILFLSLIFAACSSDVKDNETISFEYSQKLEQSLKEDNERRFENLDYSYGRFDQAMAIHYVTGMVPNVDSISQSAFELKSESLNYREDFDSKFEYNSGDINIEVVKELILEYKSFVVDLIDDDYYGKEYLREDTDKILNPAELDNFSGMSENEFRIEKTRYKGKLIEVEYLTVETLLGDLDYCKRPKE